MISPRRGRLFGRPFSSPQQWPMGTRCGITRSRPVFESCSGLENKSCRKGAAGDACTVQDATRTFQGVCTPLPLDAGLACLAPPARTPFCGDGIRDPGEACDDGNRVNGDGCDNNCTLTGCGNGIVTGN